MRIRPFVAFVAGAVLSAGVVGATTYLRAADGGVVTACANKKTGVMRYLSKGSCNRRTETQLAWNQFGIPGIAGERGEAGARGDTGAKGDVGPRGESYRVVDAKGRDLGTPIDISNFGMSAEILFQGGVWIVHNNPAEGASIAGAISASGYFSDSRCSAPVFNAIAGSLDVQTARGSYVSLDRGVIYLKPKGSPFRVPATTDLYFLNSKTNPSQCVSARSWDNEFVSTSYFIDVVETTPPTFDAPFTIVLK